MSEPTQWMKEVFTAITAKYASEDRLTRIARLRAREFSIELIQAPDERASENPLFDHEISYFGNYLRQRGLRYSQLSIAFDKKDIAGAPLAEFTFPFSALGSNVSASLSKVVTDWASVPEGRKARIKIGAIETEAATAAEIQAMFEMATEYKERCQDLGELE